MTWGHEDVWLYGEANDKKPLETIHIDDNGNISSFTEFTAYFGHIVNLNTVSKTYGLFESPRYTYEAERLSCITIVRKVAWYTVDYVRRILEKSIGVELKGGEYREFIPYDPNTCAVVTRETYRNRNRRKLLRTLQSEIEAWTKLQNYTPQVLCFAIYDDRQVVIMERGYPLRRLLEQDDGSISPALAADAVFTVIKTATEQCNVLMMDTKLDNLVIKQKDGIIHMSDDKLTAYLIDVDPKFTRFLLNERDDLGSCLIDINLTLFMLSLTTEENYGTFRNEMMRLIAKERRDYATPICSVLLKLHSTEAKNLSPGKINQESVARMVIFIALFYSARLTSRWTRCDRTSGYSQFTLKEGDEVTETAEDANELTIVHRTFSDRTLENSFVVFKEKNYKFAGKSSLILRNQDSTRLDLEEPIWPQLFTYIHGVAPPSAASRVQQDEVLFAGFA